MILIRASGTLSRSDYDAAIPELKNALALADGPLRMMIRLEDFQGWEIGALWRELRFDLSSGGAVERIAVVGETRLEEWGAALSAPFTQADMRFFPAEREDEAEAWLRTGAEKSGGSA